MQPLQPPVPGEDAPDPPDQDAPDPPAQNDNEDHMEVTHRRPTDAPDPRAGVPKGTHHIDNKHKTSLNDTDLATLQPGKRVVA
jgi:hypothetical protein